MAPYNLAEYLKNEPEVRQQIANNTFPGYIPLLNYWPPQDFADHTLVRFRGMIQDMWDPEFYLEKYEVKRKNGSGDDVRLQDGRFRDTLELKSNEEIDYEALTNVHSERRVMFLVSIPGLNDWVAKAERESNVDPNPKQQSSVALKRTLDETETMDTTEEIQEPDFKKRITDDALAEPDAKPTSSSTVLSAEYILNSPIPDRPGKACMAKVYDSFENYSLNEIVEVTGFLSVHPCLDGTNSDPSEFENLSEIQSNNPPPSLVPRLHTIHCRILKHANPLLDPMESVSMPSESFADIHNDIQLVLAQCLLGDALAAEFLMCHLISTVYLRTDMLSLGQFSLNLSNIPVNILPEYTQTLYSVLEMLMPVSHMLPLTLDNLNTIQFTPKKDYETNKLTSGMLQLAPHTQLVLDETRLQPGKLTQNGTEAIATIARLILEQKLQANFQYYNIEYNMNVAVLCLSEGKSMLPHHCQVPLKVDPASVDVIQDTIAAAKHFLQSKLPTIRALLTRLRLVEFDMQSADQQSVQDEFVAMRKRDKNVGAEDLHTRMVLARYLGTLHGRTLLDVEMWQRAKALDEERLARLAVPK